MKLTESKLRTIIREELSQLAEDKVPASEIYKGNMRDDYYRDFVEAVEQELGEDMIDTNPDPYENKAPIKVEYAARSYRKVTVRGSDLARKVESIADSAGANLRLKPLDDSGGPYEPERRHRGVDGPVM